MRNLYNLSHLAHLVGMIGRIQTISVIPVVAGESIEAQLDGVLRLAPCRKEIVSECQVDICAFFVPHRQVLGDDEWKQYVYQGINDNTTWTGIAVNSDSRQADYLCIPQPGASIPKTMVRGYNFIYQRYFAIPNSLTNGDDQAPFTNLDFFPNNGGLQPDQAAEHTRYFGRVAARLPHILNGFNDIDNQGAVGNAPELLDQDNYEVPSATVLDVRDLAAVQARYRTQAETAWFSQTYQDVMDTKWGTYVDENVDPRPEYLGRETIMLSGKEVDGTDDATLGSAVGKTLGRVNFNLRRKVFQEHGNVWFMMVLRYPLVHTREVHPFHVTVNPDPVLYLGDSTLYAAQPPVTFDPNDWLAGGTSYTPTNDVVQPYGQEYRYHPNRVHSRYEQIPGYPFLNWDASSLSPWQYYLDNEYDETFQNSQMMHWQCSMECRVNKYSYIPSVGKSIFTGAN